MGYYTEYLDRNMDFDALVKERKIQLKKISTLRRGRDILVYASDLSKNNPLVSIDYSDILPFHDQLANLNGKEIDLIIETPGGVAEVVEDLVKLIRGKYERVGIIIPGWSKSAGTIFALAGDEILMGKTSALGPIDAQILANNKRFSAEAFLEGLNKIKEEVIKTGRLNPAYIPILQNISPGEIQHCENAQDFSKKLVKVWLTKYKFKYWDKHSTTNQDVTHEEKESQANKIADILCKQSEWLTHGRSIKIQDFERIGLKVTDFSNQAELNEAILRYYTLLRMSFDTNLYKVFETEKSQIHRFLIQQGIPKPLKKEAVGMVEVDFACNKCHKNSRIQANLKENFPLQGTNLPYPLENDIFVCPNCGTQHNVKQLKMQIESQLGKKIVN